MEEETTMIEQTIGLKLLAGAGKSAIALIFVLLIEPVMDWTIVQVDQYAFLTDHTKFILADVKILVVLITAFLVLIKVIISTIKMLKEMRDKK